MMLNPEESIPKDEPEPASDHEGGGAGFTIFTNCNADGTYDVYKGPLMPATEADHPDGIFGLDSLEEALKAVIALKGQGADLRLDSDYDNNTKQAMSGGY